MQMSGRPPHRRIGLVVPTLGTRPEMLEAALRSGRAAGADHITLVTKSVELGQGLVSSGLVDDFCLDRAAGLASAINDGIRSLPPDIAYVNWLGDDDLLAQGSLSLLRDTLEHSGPRVPFAFGQCSYIDVDSRRLFVMPTGKWATLLMRVGPQLIGQPACLIRRDALTDVRGLDESLRWAFDLDMLLKLCAIEKPTFVAREIASFRWHSDSLSVATRHESVREAALIRRKHARGITKLIQALNPAIAAVILLCGKIVSRYAAARKP